MLTHHNPPLIMPQVEIGKEYQRDNNQDMGLKILHK
jgi:hypothetical protein